jgi:hypothetical protein
MKEVIQWHSFVMAALPNIRGISSTFQKHSNIFKALSKILGLSHMYRREMYDLEMYKLLQNCP